jgi:hypothetical protein
MTAMTDGQVFYAAAVAGLLLYVIIEHVLRR